MSGAGTVVVTDHPFRDLDLERSILEPEGYAVEEHQCATAEEGLRELQRRAAENLRQALARVPA